MRANSGLRKETNHLFLTHDFPPNTSGGMANYYWGLINHFPRGRVSVLTVSARGSAEIDKTCPFTVHRAFFGGDRVKLILSNVVWILYALWVMRKERTSLLHCGNMRPFGYVVGFLRMVTGVPYVIYFHGNDLMRAAAKMRRSRIKSRVFGGIIRGASAIVVNSRFTAGLVRDHLPVPVTRVLVCHPGVADDFRALNVNPPELDRTGPVTLLSVGRLTDRKGFDRVIEAMGVLVAKGLDLRYVIVGLGDQRHLRGLARQHGCESRVRFAGQVRDSAELMRHFAACDIFVMVSRALDGGEDVEGFGIVYLEAAACNRPAIGSSSGGIPEAVFDGETGLLVKDPDSVPQIARAIEELLDTPDRTREMARAAYERVNREFTWDIVVTTLLDELRTIPDMQSPLPPQDKT